MTASLVPPLKGTLDHSCCISLSYYAMIHTSDTERWAKFRLTSVVSPWSDSSLRGPYGMKFFTETPLAVETTWLRSGGVYLTETQISGKNLHLVY